MAMSTALIPSCSQTLYPQQRRGILSVGRTECRGQRGPARGLSSGVSFQGVRLAAGVSPAQLGLATSRGGVARAEQLEVGTTTATTSPPPTIKLNVGGVTEVDKDTFWPIVKSAGEKVVVLDMYTQWCGPCKLMLPQVIKLAETLVDEVIFLKLDCNQHNKVLAKELVIRVVPTFKIFKKNELFGEVTGAKYPDLVTKIDDARKSSISSPCPPNLSTL